MLPLTYYYTLLCIASLAFAAPKPITSPDSGDNLDRDRRIIQGFGKKIKDDPTGITKSWKGDDVCSFKGITCADKPSSGGPSKGSSKGSPATTSDTLGAGKGKGKGSSGSPKGSSESPKGKGKGSSPSPASSNPSTDWDPQGGGKGSSGSPQGSSKGSPTGYSPASSGPSTDWDPQGAGKGSSGSGTSGDGIGTETGLDPKGNLARDSATLQAFVKTLDSDPLGLAEDWTGHDICHWKGITCARRPDDNVTHVAGIDFNGFALTANLRLKGLIDKLLDLAFFHANSNEFRGTIPDVSALKYLYEIDLSANNLTGTFPKTVFDAPLTFLDLRFNELQGPLPDELFTKTDMDVIFLNNNKFSGPIPETKNINTWYISLANNELTGPIPKSMANNEGLKELSLEGNQLEGNIPDEICALANITLLDVSENTQLKGDLTPACQNLYNREILNIAGTGLESDCDLEGDESQGEGEESPKLQWLPQGGSPETGEKGQGKHPEINMDGSSETGETGQGKQTSKGMQMSKGKQMSQEQSGAEKRYTKRDEVEGGKKKKKKCKKPEGPAGPFSHNGKGPGQGDRGEDGGQGKGKGAGQDSDDLTAGPPTAGPATDGAPKTGTPKTGTPKAGTLKWMGTPSANSPGA